MGFIYIETDFLTSEQRRFISEVLWEVGFENDIVIQKEGVPV